MKKKKKLKKLFVLIIQIHHEATKSKCCKGEISENIFGALKLILNTDIPAPYNTRCLNHFKKTTQWGRQIRMQLYIEVKTLSWHGRACFKFTLPWHFFKFVHSEHWFQNCLMHLQDNILKCS